VDKRLIDFIENHKLKIASKYAFWFNKIYYNLILFTYQTEVIRSNSKIFLNYWIRVQYTNWHNKVIKKWITVKLDPIKIGLDRAHGNTVG